MALPPPTVAALVPCEAVYVDSVSGRASLLGLFGGLAPPAFPHPLPPCRLYLALVGGRGAVPLALRLVGPDDAPLWAFDLGNVNFPDPLHVKEPVVPVAGVTLPGPGLYRWQVLCAGAVVHERVLPVQRR